MRNPWKSVGNHESQSQLIDFDNVLWISMGMWELGGIRRISVSSISDNWVWGVRFPGSEAFGLGCLFRLDTASETRPVQASHSARFGCAWQCGLHRGGWGCGHIGGGLERPQLARNGLLSPVPSPSPSCRRPRSRPRPRRTPSRRRRRGRACACPPQSRPWPTATGSAGWVGGLVVFRRRLSVDLGVGELVHHVLHRSRGARRLLAKELGDVEDVLGVGARGLLLGCASQSAASIVSGVSTPLKAAHVVTRSGACPFAALWSMFSAKPSACPRIELIFAIALAVSFCELRSAFAFKLIISLIVLAWRLSWVLASSVAFAYLRCSASRDLPSSRIWLLRWSMWAWRA